MKHVLIIEDDAETREGIAELLASEGYSVSQARDGQEGLREARQRHPHLILLDLMLPVLNGLEFRAAQRGDPTLAGIPVIVTSAVATEPWSEGDLGDVAARFPKPFDSAALLEAVARHASRSVNA